MRIILAHNWYRQRGGEDAAVDQMETLLTRRGHAVTVLARDSGSINAGFLGRARVALTGAYSTRSARAMARMIDKYSPDLVHAHNLYPLLTPSVLVECRRRGIPVVMTCHNYRMTCPALYHLSKGTICERCVGGREYWCVLRNCRGSVTESITFAGWSMFARKLNLLKDNVTLFLALTEFFRKRLIAMGIEASRVRVLPNMVEIPPEDLESQLGDYVAFTGRLSPEKGVKTLLEAAARLPHVKVKIAGDGPCYKEYSSSAPPNVTFMGRLASDEINSFYRSARMLVLPSVWFEMCPLVLSEAMGHGLPIIASRVGGIPELVEDGRNGLLFEMGNAAELAERIERLWVADDLCLQYGRVGREKALRDYAERTFYDGLMGAYDCARALTPNASAI
jgi:glycosyltransferase involved in cell wall biosynthesis